MKLGVNIDPYLKGIVMLVISIGANYIGDTLNCNTRKLLENMFIKHLFSFTLLYVTIDMSIDSKKINPTEQFKASIITYIAYLMFTKMNLYFVIAASILGATAFVLGRYLNYWKEKGDDDDPLYKKIKRRKEIIEAMLVYTICIGFIFYFYEKKVQHKENFDYIKFIFGRDICKDA